MKAETERIECERAEAVFQAALVARYGAHAGDMRYRTRILPPDIYALAMGYQSAMQAWQDAWFTRTE
jgi:hypothetical protein